MLKAVRRWQFGLRNLLGRSPGIGLPLFRAVKGTGGGAEAVGDATEIVLEGFPRSANTFSVVAFRVSQPRPVSVAHHLHISAQIIEGTRRELPVVLLVREPVAAIASLMVRDPFVTPVFGMRYYIDFHQRVLPVLDKVVVARFEDVTSAFGRVIERTNDRFRSDFTPFVHSAENVDACFAEIDRMNRIKFGGGKRVVGSGVARPAASRAQATGDLVTEIRGSVPPGLLERASGLFELVNSRGGA